MPSIEIENGSFDYTVIRTSRRTLAIHIDPARGVVVRAPKRARESDIRRFLLEKSSWVRKKHAEARQRAAELPRHDYMTGDVFLFRGEEYSLAFETAKRDGVEIAGHYLLMGLRPGAPREKVPEILERWYRERAREVFQERVRFYSRKLGVSPPGFTVRGQRKRWGSCSSRGNINLNWKLMMAPPEILDYVVAHELAHLLHPNHQEDFWNLLEGLVPDQKACRAWLKENGHKLAL